MKSPEFSSSTKVDQSEGKFIDFKKLSEEMQTYPFGEEEVLQAFSEIVKSLGEKLTTYDTIISDDTSGRLVSLVLRKVINEARKRKGLEEINTYFLASGQIKPKNKEILIKAIKDFLQKKKAKTQKALVVTEHISSGRSIMQLITILESLDIPFEIAALGIRYNPKEYPQSITNRLHYGKPMSGIGLDFYNRDSLTGVKKDKDRDPSTSPHPVKNPDSSQAIINKTRQDVDRLAEELKKLI